MSDAIERIVEVLKRHKELEDPQACSCGHWGIGYHEGYEWHVAREIVVAAAFQRVLKQHAGVFDKLKDM